MESLNCYFHTGIVRFYLDCIESETDKQSTMLYLSIFAEPIVNNYSISLPKMYPNTIADFFPGKFDSAEIDSAEAEEIERLERLMLDREDYYQLGYSSY
jgi:hypothetical protein